MASHVLLSVPIDRPTTACSSDSPMDEVDSAYGCRRPAKTPTKVQPGPGPARSDDQAVLGIRWLRQGGHLQAQIHRVLVSCLPRAETGCRACYVMPAETARRFGIGCTAAHLVRTRDDWRAQAEHWRCLGSNACVGQHVGPAYNRTVSGRQLPCTPCSTARLMPYMLGSTGY